MESLTIHETPTKGKRLYFKSIQEMADFIFAGHVIFVDAVFCDVFGVWHHCTFAPSQCSMISLKQGFPFDGSSIPLFTTVDQSDIVMCPDPTTCWIDPFTKHTTLHVVCNIAYPNGEPFPRCPRQIALRASGVLSEVDLGDALFVGAEPEFFVFDHVRYAVNSNEIAVEVDGAEASWNNSAKVGSSSLNGSNNLCHRLQKKHMYFPVSPSDTMMDLRGDMLLTMKDLGLDIEKHHHEVAIFQAELGYAYGPFIEAADQLMTYKYVVKNIAKLQGKTATFMPKPIHGDNGSGLHIHHSIWDNKNNTNLFFDLNGIYCKLSPIAIHYIAGILKHAPALMAFTNPTTNSYKRLLPGYEAPCRLTYSKGNRSAAIRIPLCDIDNPKTKRIEIRFPDSSCCPYLAFSALLLAGIDGILNKLNPPPPWDKDVFEIDMFTQNLTLPSIPHTLLESLEALEHDYEFLLRNNVFSMDFIKSYIELKKLEAFSVTEIPHPKEFELYYHC